jgi:hypothetical protein
MTFNFAVLRGIFDRIADSLRELAKKYSRTILERCRKEHVGRPRCDHITPLGLVYSAEIPHNSPFTHDPRSQQGYVSSLYYLDRLYSASLIVDQEFPNLAGHAGATRAEPSSSMSIGIEC